MTKDVCRAIMHTLVTSDNFSFEFDVEDQTRQEHQCRNHENIYDVRQAGCNDGAEVTDLMKVLGRQKESLFTRNLMKSLHVFVHGHETCSCHQRHDRF